MKSVSLPQLWCHVTKLLDGYVHSDHFHNGHDDPRKGRLNCVVLNCQIDGVPLDDLNQCMDQQTQLLVEWVPQLQDLKVQLDLLAEFGC